MKKPLLVRGQGGAIAPLNPALGRSQAMFDKLAKQYANSGVIPAPGYLLLARPLTGNTSLVQFKTLENQELSANFERRLKLNDTFTITGVSFYIAFGPQAGAAPTPQEQAGVQMLTYPNQVLLTAGVAPNYEALYNSYLSLRIDTQVFIDSVSLRSFYRAGQAQQGTGAGVVMNRDEWSGAMFGRNEMTPTVELNGTATIEWDITLPTTIDLTPPANFVTYAVLNLTGFLNQGAANEQRLMQRRLRQVNKMLPG